MTSQFWCIHLCCNTKLQTSKPSAGTKWFQSRSRGHTMICFLQNHFQQPKPHRSSLNTQKMMVNKKNEYMNQHNVCSLSLLREKNRMLVSFSHISTLLDPTGTINDNIFVFVWEEWCYKVSGSFTYWLCSVKGPIRAASAFSQISWLADRLVSGGKSGPGKTSEHNYENGKNSKDTLK